ncbi:hypothetical protein ONZ45_g4943 [Pleurotus djamor]|nr:hypothetical protein ONZ45_g4943 [Pleurotus djamor]
MSFFQRLWRFVQTNKPARLIGRDLEGNSYYERFNPNNPTRAKRTVKYYAEQDMWRYIGGERRLAVQWTAWLSHTRAHPPTLEELEQDAARVERVRYNAAMIEARERQEREEALRLGEGIPPAINDSDYQPTEPIAPPHIQSQGDVMPMHRRNLKKFVQQVNLPAFRHRKPESQILGLLRHGVEVHDVWLLYRKQKDILSWDVTGMHRVTLLSSHLRYTESGTPWLVLSAAAGWIYHWMTGQTFKLKAARERYASPSET